MVFQIIRLFISFRMSSPLLPKNRIESENGRESADVLSEDCDMHTRRVSRFSSRYQPTFTRVLLLVSILFNASFLVHTIPGRGIGDRGTPALLYCEFNYPSVLHFMMLLIRHIQHLLKKRSGVRSGSFTEVLIRTKQSIKKSLPRMLIEHGKHYMMVVIMAD